MRIIYVSPHLDDAILSAGGPIHVQSRAGMEVQVWTVMAGTPPGEALSETAIMLHDEWGVGSAREAIENRRDEDARACSGVGARCVHLDFLDAIYRRALDGAWLYSDIFQPPSAADADLARRIAGVLAERLAPEDQVVCPLAVGGHVDHILVRVAVELLERSVIYMADVPYVFRHGPQVSIVTQGLHSDILPFQEDSLSAWIDAVSTYRSQIQVLFGDAELMRRQLRGYWEPERGVRSWCASHGPLELLVRPPEV